MPCVCGKCLADKDRGGQGCLSGLAAGLKDRGSPMGLRASRPSRVPRAARWGFVWCAGEGAAELSEWSEDPSYGTVPFGGQPFGRCDPPGDENGKAPTGEHRRPEGLACWRLERRLSAPGQCIRRSAGTVRLG